MLQFTESRLSSLLIDVGGVVDADDAHPPKWLEIAARLSREVALSYRNVSRAELFSRACARIAFACKDASTRLRARVLAGNQSSTGRQCSAAHTADCVGHICVCNRHQADAKSSPSPFI